MFRTNCSNRTFDSIDFFKFYLYCIIKLTLIRGSEMFGNIAFKLDLQNLQGSQYRWSFSARLVSEGEYELVLSAIVGVATWEDLFPLTYSLGNHLRTLEPRQLELCEEIIHNNLAVWIPCMLVQMGYGHILFTPAFPRCVGHGKIFNEIVRQLDSNNFLLAGRDR